MVRQKQSLLKRTSHYKREIFIVVDLPSITSEVLAPESSMSIDVYSYLLPVSIDINTTCKSQLSSLSEGRHFFFLDK